MSSASAGMDAAAIDGWAFGWLPFDMALPMAQLAVRLRWQGLTLDILADGLGGVDTRLDAPAVHSLPQHLQTVVLSHFAEQVLRAAQAAPLAATGGLAAFSGLALQSLQWHETPVAMADGWPFVLRAPGVMGCSLGRLRVLDADGRPDSAAQDRLLAALASVGAPLPEALAQVDGRLRIARLLLAREELATLDEGDWVWLPDAEITPRGLRSQFRPEVGGPGCEAWLQRGHMLRSETPMVEAGAIAQAADAPCAAGLLPLSVVGPLLGVPRAWWHGAQPRLALPGSVMGERWVAMAGAVPWFEGRLQLHGRRLALQVTRVLHHDAVLATVPSATTATTAMAAATTTTTSGA